jgi:hypothetical protein
LAGFSFARTLEEAAMQIATSHALARSRHFLSRKLPLRFAVGISFFTK